MSEIQTTEPDTDNVIVGLIVFAVITAILTAAVILKSTKDPYAAILIMVLVGVFTFAIAAAFRRHIVLETTEEVEALRLEAEEWRTEGHIVWSHLNNEAPVKRGSISNTMHHHILERDDYTCLYCGVKGTADTDPDGAVWHIDHLQPVSRGGATIPANLALTCNHCNLSKGKQSAIEFMKRRARTYRGVNRANRPIHR